MFFEGKYISSPELERKTAQRKKSTKWSWHHGWDKTDTQENHHAMLTKNQTSTRFIKNDVVLKIDDVEKRILINYCQIDDAYPYILFRGEDRESDHKYYIIHLKPEIDEINLFHDFSQFKITENNNGNKGNSNGNGNYK